MIRHTRFGSINVGNMTYGHDIYITGKGKVKKRKKKLSKAIYGTSHTISVDEIKLIIGKDTEGIVIGSGQEGVARLSDEAMEFLEQRNCEIILKPTPDAIYEWNRADGKWVGLFHITC